MKKKTIVGLIVIAAIVLVAMFAGGIEQKGESGGKVKGVPLSVNIVKEFQVHTQHTFLSPQFNVYMEITNTGNKPIDLSQFVFTTYWYDPNLRAYQKGRGGYLGRETLGPGASIKELIFLVHPLPTKEEKYKVVIKRQEDWREEGKKVFETEFSVTSEDCNNPIFYKEIP